MAGLSYISKYYSVPARRGGRVEYAGNGKIEQGTITGSSGAHLMVRIDGREDSSPFHPTWKIRYLEDEASALVPQQQNTTQEKT